jgi:hypothetical protein
MAENSGEQCIPASPISFESSEISPTVRAARPFPGWILVVVSPSIP